MRVQTNTLRMMLMLLISGFAFAQSKTNGPNSLFVRLSYTSGHIVDWRQEQGNPKICLALYRSGYFRVSRLAETGTETLQGTLSADRLLRLRNMLEDLDFQSSGAGLVHEGADMLVVEVVRKGKTMHYVWTDPDHQRPFPSSAMSIVKWLQAFKPEGAYPLNLRELSEQPSLCPPLFPEPIVPLVARLHAALAGSSCRQP